MVYFRDTVILEVGRYTFLINPELMFSGSTSRRTEAIVLGRRRPKQELNLTK